MEISIKDLNAVMEHMNTMAAKLWETAESTIEMAKGIQAIIDDYAAQMKAKKEAPAAGKPAAKSKTPATTNAPERSAPAKSNPAPDAKKISLEEFRAYVIERTNPKTREDIKGLLRYYNVKNLTNLPEEHYAEFMETVEKLYKNEVEKS